MKSKDFNAVVLIVAVVSRVAVSALACGPDFPNNLLDAGDHAVLQPPIANFQRELERMKLVRAGLKDGNVNETTEQEMRDLAAALKRQKMSSELSIVVMQAHLAERMKLSADLEAQAEWRNSAEWAPDEHGYHKLTNTNPPPVSPAIAITPGLPPEFALYFQGAIAWEQNREADAYWSWKTLLELPPEKRPYKSIWAAFMLGNFAKQMADRDADEAIKAGDFFGDRWMNATNKYNEAVAHYHEVRELAKAGFVDSAGLVAASLGWEAQINLREKNYEQAIELYLQQAAAGDGTSVNSLRFTAKRLMADTNMAPAQLKSLALNPRTRPVITAYLISRDPHLEWLDSETVRPDSKQLTIWLKAVESAKVKDVESASQLALAAYQADEMEIAQRWINRAGNEPVAQWLQAKLFMRAGKIAEAAKLLSKLARKLPQDYSSTDAPTSFAANLRVNIDDYDPENIGIGRQALGELGALHLARREYTEALDALLRSGYWSDTAYVAERVLTLDELKQYVDRNWPSVSKTAALSGRTGWWNGDDWAKTNPREAIRYLLARRLARESGGSEALAYFPTNYSGEYETLLAELRAGRDETLPAEVRARNLFAAAIMTRTNGMELFGTELEPDFAIYGGSYQSDVIWTARATNSVEAKINLASDEEIGRVLRHHVEPDRRFHYRYRAADLAWEAAQLLPDNSDETARVLCTAGTWLKIRDPQAADKFYKALVRRCRKTAIGAQADRMRWFPVLDENGNPKPWSPPKRVAASEESSETGTNNSTAAVVSPPAPPPPPVMPESNSATAPTNAPFW